MAQTVADVFVTEFIARFGMPAKIHSDQGREFESNLFIILLNSWDGENLVITDITGDRVSLRPEQPADMPCGEDEPPIKDVAGSVIGRADLFDAEGHLKLTVAYLRGC